ncbi:hypothetical protein CLOP_g4822, partial [Closterium sp. NIES-67]
MHWEKIEIKVKPHEPIPGKSPGRKGGKHGPGRKWGHTLNAVNYGRQVYVFGGYGKDERQTNDVYVYNTTKDAWSKPNIKGTPPSPRDSHTSTVVGSRLFVFGGTDGSSGSTTSTCSTPQRTRGRGWQRRETSQQHGRGMQQRGWRGWCTCLGGAARRATGGRWTRRITTTCMCSTL